MDIAELVKVAGLWTLNYYSTLHSYRVGNPTAIQGGGDRLHPARIYNQPRSDVRGTYVPLRSNLNSRHTRNDPTLKQPSRGRLPEPASTAPRGYDDFVQAQVILKCLKSFQNQ